MPSSRLVFQVSLFFPFQVGKDHAANDLSSTALRTLILGQISRGGTSSAPHYELGSSRHTRVQASVAATSRHDNYLNSGHNTNKHINDSEDELVKDTESNSRSSYLNEGSNPPAKNTIAVTTEFQVHEETGNRNMVKF